ncbi:MAG: hypothetical protein GVY30_00955 [Chloroflexi bacterium]|jgi:hypothetical protein|nr:hypothetical protein [Chloroflexota bacterium]
MSTATIQAQTHVEVSQKAARQWFLELKEHPERYQFDTHAGFTFTQGDFGEVGARFETQERFYGLRLTLRFELTEVGDTEVRFRVLRPPAPIWGAFLLEAEGPQQTLLTLRIGSDSQAGAAFLNLPLVRGAIQRQIQAEVENIRDSMERTQT